MLSDVGGSVESSYIKVTDMCVGLMNRYPCAMEFKVAAIALRDLSECWSWNWE